MCLYTENMELKKEKHSLDLVYYYQHFLYIIIEHMFCNVEKKYFAYALPHSFLDYIRCYV